MTESERLARVVTKEKVLGELEAIALLLTRRRIDPDLGERLEADPAYAAYRLGMLRERLIPDHVVVAERRAVEGA